MDTFTEELVIKQNTKKDIAKLTAYLLAIFAVPAIFILLGVTVNFYFIIVAVCAFFFAIYGSYYLVTGLYLEYEYTVTNSNITIDKVIAKRSRKRIISVDIKHFNNLKKLKDTDFSKKSYKKIFKASITPDGDDVYAAEMHLDKFGGECLLVFSPGEKTLESMKPYLKNTIRAELFKVKSKKAPANKSTAEINKTEHNKSEENKKSNAEETKTEIKKTNETIKPKDKNNNPEIGNTNKDKQNSGSKKSKKKKTT